MKSKSTQLVCSVVSVRHSRERKCGVVQITRIIRHNR